MHTNIGDHIARIENGQPTYIMYTSYIYTYI